jgi:4-amino-4-deoxy-L-arabinose transferase-like glycosyltransferase
MSRRFNWPLWSGLLLVVVAVVSYFAIFTRFPVTRDVPWVSFILLAIAIALLISGWRRASRKILPSIVTALGLLLVGAFTYTVTLGSRNLPASDRAPAVGQMAPGFALPDTNNRTVALADVLSQSRGVLLVFYRGYW